MKKLIWSALFVLSTSLTAFADTSNRFIIFDENGDIETDPFFGSWHYLDSGYNKSCFVGDAKAIVADINNWKYWEGDDSLQEASLINDDTITFTFWGMTDGNVLTVSRCSFE